MKEIVTLFIITILSFEALGQQDAQYTQYMYNTAIINPAYTGSRDKSTVSGLSRKQWAGFDGSPETFTLGVESPLNRFSNLSYGLSIIHDRIKPTAETSLNFDFSYKFRITDTGFLRLGTKVGGNFLNVDLTNLSREQANDNALLVDINNKFSPSFGLGVYYHNDNTYVGLSVPNMLQTKFFDENNVTSSLNSTNLLATQKMNFYLMAGYAYDINYNVKFKPALLTKVVAGAPLQVDLSANFLFFRKMTLGAAYRWSTAVSGLFAYQLSNSLMIGMAYDYETTEIISATNSYGSFEFIMRYDLKNKLNLSSKRILTPRFF